MHTRDQCHYWECFEEDDNRRIPSLLLLWVVRGTISLFAGGVSERIIQGRSGHSFLEAL